MKEKKLNTKSKIKTLASDNKAITLIALVITIIIMLILVGVTVSIAINGGLFNTAKKATAETQYQADREMLLSAVVGAIDNNAEVDFTELDKNLPNGFIVTEDGLYTSKAGNTFYVNKTGNIINPVTVTVGTETVMLTPKNVGEYLGKVVSNYKIDNNTTETITIDEKEYRVSTKYRLYYVDFDNKYKDGVGTIYLKADSTENKYSLPTIKPSEGDVVKTKELNPELYKAGVTPPNENNNNMKKVTWLTNTNNWNELKNGVDEILSSNINYVIGAPSLEMMMDSYNTHYDLTGDVSEKKDLSESSEFVKLFYKYPYKGNNYGYAVAPCSNNSDVYGYTTIFGAVRSDPKINSLYHPNGNIYFLSSPIGLDQYSVGIVPYVASNVDLGLITVDNEDASYSLCPLASLKSSADIKLEQ